MDEDLYDFELPSSMGTPSAFTALSTSLGTHVATLQQLEIDYELIDCIQKLSSSGSLIFQKFNFLTKTGWNPVFVASNARNFSGFTNSVLYS